MKALCLLILLRYNNQHLKLILVVKISKTLILSIPSTKYGIVICHVTPIVQKFYCQNEANR